MKLKTEALNSEINKFLGNPQAFYYVLREVVHNLDPELAVLFLEYLGNEDNFNRFIEFSLKTKDKVIDFVNSISSNKVALAELRNVLIELLSRK